MTDIKVGDKVRHIGYRTNDREAERLVTSVGDGVVSCIIPNAIGVCNFPAADLQRTHECLGWREVPQEPEWWPPQVHDVVQFVDGFKGHYGDSAMCAFGADGTYLGRYDDDEILVLHHKHGSKLLFRLTPIERGEDK